MGEPSLASQFTFTSALQEIERLRDEREKFDNLVLSYIIATLKNDKLAIKMFLYLKKQSKAK